MRKRKVFKPNKGLVEVKVKEDNDEESRDVKKKTKKGKGGAK